MLLIQNILAQACQNETNEAAKRQRLDSTDLPIHHTAASQNVSPTSNNHATTYRVHALPQTTHVQSSVNNSIIHMQAKAMEEHRKGKYKTNMQQKCNLLIRIYFVFSV